MKGVVSQLRASADLSCGVAVGGGSAVVSSREQVGPARDG